MNTQKKHRKTQLEAYEDRGDMLRRNRKEIQPTAPRDRGDSRRKNVSKQGSIKTNKTESVKTDLVSRSTNTFADSVPVSFENHAINADGSSEKCLDFRKRIKDRYTFKRYLKDDVTGGFRCGVENELPKYSHFESSGKPKSKDSRETKKSDIASVHRAVSTMKIKRNKPDDLAERKKTSVEKDKNSKKDKKPLIKTIRSKMDTRVYKAVTFVEHTPKKPLHIKIPNKEPKYRPNSRIPLIVPDASTVQSTRRVMRKRRPTPQPSPSLKSADSLPTEIAKWVPESIDQHTKPYYEAWVSKTATASTKLLKEASLEKSKVLRSMELEMRKSPELLYKRYEEEQYKGRIRVRRRGEK